MTSDVKLRTALVVAVPEAAPVVDPWRERTSAAKPSAGVPAHLTIVFPFVEPRIVTEPLLEDLRALFVAIPSFTCAFATPARFDSVLYLAPLPAEPIVHLTQAVWDAYPDYPPYGGELETIVPHLTAAEGDPTTLDEAESDIRRFLPIATHVTEVVLLEELEPDAARWGTRASLPLAPLEHPTGTRDRASYKL
jgi:hypothetical protein